jgi:hypothetical protein
MGVAAVACKPRKRARKAKQAGSPSPEKRAHGGKPTASVGPASGLDRSYKRLAMSENRARYLEDRDPGHHGVLRVDTGNRRRQTANSTSRTVRYRRNDFGGLRAR